MPVLALSLINLTLKRGPLLWLQKLVNYPNCLVG